MHDERFRVCILHLLIFQFLPTDSIHNSSTALERRTTREWMAAGAMNERHRLGTLRIHGG